MYKALKETTHHALVAAVIASFVFIAEQQHLLGWLDAISIRMSQAINLDNHQVNSADIPDDTPVVLHITDTMYENVFFQKAPLDRSKLAILIDEITKKKPAAIAIDLDLSPGADEFFLPSIAQIELDRSLKKATRGCSPKEKCITLVTPQIVQSEEVRAQQYHWMKSRCIDGIEFSFPTLVMHQAVAISYPSSLPNLGNVVPRAGAGRNTKEGLCGYISAHNHSQFFSYQNLATAGRGIKTRQLNTSFFHYLKDPSSKLELNLDTIDDVANLELKNKVVFLGGSYGKGDTFLTVTGAFSGVSLHAAGYFSKIHSITNTTHAAAFFLDIIIGILLGFIFVFSWELYGRSKSSYLKISSIVNYLKMRSLLIINLFLMLFILIAFYLVSGYLLEAQLWLNPGPLVIGMFIHGLLTSKHTTHVEHECGHGYTKGLIRHHPDLIWQIPLITFVLFSFFHH